MSASLPPRPAPSLWTSLSLLRFALAAIVAASHVKSFYGPTLTSLDPVKMLSSLNGHAAVVGFLLVSGFSIAHSIRTERSQYVWRRFLRIYPLYLPAVLFCVWVGGYEVPGVEVGRPVTYAAPGLGETLGNLFMLQCVLVEPLSNNGPLWTLSLEWWCYLAAPLLVLLSRRQLLGLLVVLILTHLSWVLFDSRFSFYGRAPYGLHLVFLGVFWLAGFCYYERRTEAWAGLGLALLVWMLTGFNRDNLMGNYQLTLAVSVLVLIAGAGLSWPGWLIGPVRLLGNVSYPLYLLHKPIFHLAYDGLGLRQGWQLWLVAVLGAVAAYLCVETPLRKLLQSCAGHLKNKT